MTTPEFFLISGSITFLLLLSWFLLFSLTQKWVKEKIDNNNQELVCQFESLLVDGAPKEFGKIIFYLVDEDIVATFLAMRYFTDMNYNDNWYILKLRLS